MKRWFPALLGLMMLAGIAPANAAPPKVSPNSMVVSLAGGEIASAVVPPGKKVKCMGGRVLIANDWVRPGTGTRTGIVTGINLDGSGTVTTSTHDAPPNATKYSYGSNDHNLVSLPEGDVIYQAAAFSKETSSVAWFSFVFRGNFGPGARSVQLTWRSEDCGETFTFVKKADPLTFSDGGLCANPQGDGKIVDGKAIYDMGGSDGPRLDVDRKSGRLILTFGCVGRHQLGFQPATCKKEPDPLKPNQPQFLLSHCSLNITYVLTSDDRGDTWKAAGKILNGSRWFWRGAAMPTKNGLAIAFGGDLYFGKTSGDGYDFSGVPDQLPGDWGYDDTFQKKAISKTKNNPTLIRAGVTGPAVIARVPGRSDLLLTAMARTLDVMQATSPGPVSRTHGYSVFLENIDSRKTAEIAPVMALGSSPGDVVMHLTAIDLGVGPVLLYWYDVSTKNKEALIRGRVIYDADLVSEDFTISLKAGADAPFPLRPEGLAKAYFYGDYKMAEGFAGPVPASPTQARKYTFLPAWVQPDGTAHVATVEVMAGGVAAQKPEGIRVPPVFVKRAVPRKGVGITPLQLDMLKGHEMERGREQVPVP
jgi:hypothetical protein